MSNKGSNGTLEFKVGDLVYYPSQSLELLKLQQNNIGGSLYPLTLDGLGAFTADGRSCVNNVVKSLFLATEENRILLNSLYGVEFEKPFNKNSSEATIKLLEQGKLVLCYISDYNDTSALGSKSIRLIEGFDKLDGTFRDLADVSWDYAVPVYNTIEFTTGE